MSQTNSTPSAQRPAPPLEDLVKAINARGMEKLKSAPLTRTVTWATKSALRATAPTPKATPAPSPVKAMSAFDKAMSTLKPTDPGYILAKFAELNGTDTDDSVFSTITSPSSMDTDDEESE